VASEYLTVELQIRNELRESIEVMTRSLEQRAGAARDVAELLISTFRSGGKALLFGNGGSAADAQHVAAELVNRVGIERDGLPAIALTTDTSVITSVGNDFAFDQIFARQVQALVKPGDVVVGISTSGNSANVVNGILVAKSRGATTVGFTGHPGGRLAPLVDVLFTVPSASTPRIQEVHIAVWHGICAAVEGALFGGQ
jgi:D-sedoheptulose 7-phosphate isomerase